MSQGGHLAQLPLKLDDEVIALYPSMVEWRRHFHRYPELSLQEHRTSDYIKSLIGDLVDELYEGLGGTGLLGVIRASQGTPKLRVLFRADMDALPIEEETDLPYKSEVKGVMHACGHDFHMAILIGLVQVARRMKEEGTLGLDVGFLFQPGEEGGFGAQKVIESGLWDLFPADYVIGLHIWAKEKLGRVGIAEGPIMAAFDEFYVEILGPGGHASAPHETKDITMVLGHVITALYNLAYREFNPMKPSVLTIGYVHGGKAPNVIPKKYSLGGTIRTYYPDDRERFKRRLEELLRGLSQAFKTEIKLEMREGYPVTLNDKRLTELALRVAERIGLELFDPRGLGSEDFSYYLERVPGLYVIVGADTGKSGPHHSPTFSPDERALAVGLQFFKELLRELNEISD